jgi:hypothetical protein
MCPGRDHKKYHCKADLVEQKISCVNHKTSKLQTVAKMMTQMLSRLRLYLYELFRRFAREFRTVKSQLTQYHTF